MIPAAQFRRGVEEFNRREFYEAHETLEAIWLKAPEPEKTFLQGIIQVSCAFHHYVRGNRAGAESLMRRGLEKLEWFPAGYGKIKLQPLREEVRWWLEEIVAGRNPARARLPRAELNENR
jgi:predicted metal-dependent hydrolase